MKNLSISEEELNRVHTKIIGIEPKWAGILKGYYTLNFANGNILELDLQESTLFRQIDRLFKRYYHYENSMEIYPWRLFITFRENGYEYGNYVTEYAEGVFIDYNISEWDAEMLYRYSKILERISIEKLV